MTLLATGTEVVCALDCGDRLVARSHECDHPEWVRRLPAVTRARLDPSAFRNPVSITIAVNVMKGRLSAIGAYGADRGAPCLAAFCGMSSARITWPRS